MLVFYEDICGFQTDDSDFRWKQYYSKDGKGHYLVSFISQRASLVFFFILALITFHLKPLSATLHWLIFPKPNKLTTSEAVSSNFSFEVDFVAVI